MKNVIIATLFLFSISTYSQIIGDGFSVATEKQKLDFRQGHDANESGIGGKPYFLDVFTPANIDGYEGIYLLRYNAAKDEMEFEKEKKVLYIVKSFNLKITFLSTKKQYRYVEYNYEKETINGYLVLLKENDKVSLYKREKIKLIPKSEATSSYSSDVPAHYETSKDTYFIKSGESINLFPKNKKELVRMYPSNEKEIVDFLKTKKISFSDENDIIILVNFLNTI